MKIKAFFAIALLVLLLSACAAPAVTALPGIEAPSAENPAAPASPEATPTAEPTLYTEYVNGSFWLRLASPKDGEIVDEPQIEISGQAPAETVLSINDEILLIGADETFALPMTLEEGVTLIEMVASSPQGEMIELVLSVVYEKN